MVKGLVLSISFSLCFSFHFLVSISQPLGGEFTRFISLLFPGLELAASRWVEGGRKRFGSVSCTDILKRRQEDSKNKPWHSNCDVNMKLSAELAS